MNRRAGWDVIRDSILAVSGTLNLKMGGIGVIPPLSKEDTGGANAATVAGESGSGRAHAAAALSQMKRSMTFCCKSRCAGYGYKLSHGERIHRSAQALALNNSEFSGAQAKQFAARIAKQAARIRRRPWKRVAAGVGRRRLPRNARQRSII